MPGLLSTGAARTAAIERRLDFRASPERLWRALTDPAELGTWLAGASVELDLRPGGAGAIEWAEHGRFALRVEVVEAPRRLAWRWARDPDTALDAGVSTLVEWDLTPLPDGGTRLHLRESGFVRPPDRVDNTQGWLGGLGELAKLVAREPWEAGIARTWALAAPRERVWASFADPVKLAEWWTRNPSLAVEPGAEGWMDWPGEGGRFAIRFEAVEPPGYLCWSWVTDANVPLDEATQVLRTEWLMTPRPDGGTDLTLLETGFTTEREQALNDGGWDADILPALRRLLGEAAAD